MTWTPRSGHVTQLHADGSGWNDCWEASQVRAMRELGLLSVDGDPMAQINEVSLAARGLPDRPLNQPTSLPQCSAGLDHYGIKYTWTESYTEALTAAMAICWVNGIVLRPQQYPPSWFSGENFLDHFILWLPQWKGSSYWFNDPLASNYKDCEYDNLAVAFGGAFILPAPTGAPSLAVKVLFPQACAMNSKASHDPLVKTVLCHIPAGGTGLLWGTTTSVGTEKWSRVQWRNFTGWVPATKIIRVG